MFTMLGNVLNTDRVGWTIVRGGIHTEVEESTRVWRNERSSSFIQGPKICRRSTAKLVLDVVHGLHIDAQDHLSLRQMSLAFGDFKFWRFR